jgi:hypothetical protein
MIIVFAGMNYYPLGGANDIFKVCYSSEEADKAMKDAYALGNDWVHTWSNEGDKNDY